MAALLAASVLLFVALHDPVHYSENWLRHAQPRVSRVRGARVFPLSAFDFGEVLNGTGWREDDFDGDSA